MDTPYIEANYPLTFRKEDATVLGQHLKLRHSVELVGMKRVGISNFLRFFLHNPKIVETYINHGEKHLFISVDLNDLVEVEIFPFWRLTFKRLVDTVSNSKLLSSEVKAQISAIFKEATKSQDIFITVEGLRKALILVCANKVMPTLFLLRFDRVGSVVNAQFYANLVGLRDGTGEKLAYVFTSFRTLEQIAPKVFERKMLSVFSHPMFVKPAVREDFEVIFRALGQKYELKNVTNLEETILSVCGGHVQYLQLAAIVLSHKKDLKAESILDTLQSDERIRLLGEEIWESLNITEQAALLKVHKGQKVEEEEKKGAYYLWETGMVRENHQSHIFGKLFEVSLNNREQNSLTGDSDDRVEFTKKEHLLYNYLLEHVGEVCEREKIIEAVWSEVEDLGVSDWTIDRLVARLRTKLKKQGSNYKIITVKTRGYKLL